MLYKSWYEVTVCRQINSGKNLVTWLQCIFASALFIYLWPLRSVFLNQIKSSKLHILITNIAQSTLNNARPVILYRLRGKHFFKKNSPNIKYYTNNERHKSSWKVTICYTYFFSVPQVHGKMSQDDLQIYPNQGIQPRRPVVFSVNHNFNSQPYLLSSSTAWTLLPMIDNDHVFSHPFKISSTRQSFLQGNWINSNSLVWNL